jgi:hypothetical protein
MITGRNLRAFAKAHGTTIRRLDDARAWQRACEGAALLPNALAARNWTQAARALEHLGLDSAEAERVAHRLRCLHRAAAVLSSS